MEKELSCAPRRYVIKFSNTMTIGLFAFSVYDFHNGQEYYSSHP